MFLTSLPLFCFFIPATISAKYKEHLSIGLKSPGSALTHRFISTVCVSTCWSYSYRHPVMAKWPVGHKWFFMKLDLIQVWLQDWTGGISVVPLEDYFKATPFWNVTCYLVLLSTNLQTPLLQFSCFSNCQSFSSVTGVWMYLYSKGVSRPWPQGPPSTRVVWSRG